MHFSWIIAAIFYVIWLVGFGLGRGESAGRHQMNDHQALARARTVPGDVAPARGAKTGDATERHVKIEEMARTGSLELAATAHLLLVQEVKTAGNGLPEVVSLTCTGRDRKDRLQLGRVRTMAILTVGTPTPEDHFWHVLRTIDPVVAALRAYTEDQGMSSARATPQMRST